jgi:hypothetical protein
VAADEAKDSAPGKDSAQVHENLSRVLVFNRKEEVKEMDKEIRCCGQILRKGTGYFATDYLCDKCGAEYNSAGNRLAPRNMWGEETGEQF